MIGVCGRVLAASRASPQAISSAAPNFPKKSGNWRGKSDSTFQCQ
jgi:hypothetical protein